MQKTLKTFEIHRLIRLASRQGFRLSVHARKRMDERGYVPDDVRCCLGTGIHNPLKDEWKGHTWRYRIFGKSVDGHDMELAVAIESDVIVVTVITPNK